MDRQEALLIRIVATVFCVMGTLALVHTFMDLRSFVQAHDLARTIAGKSAIAYFLIALVMFAVVGRMAVLIAKKRRLGG